MSDSIKSKEYGNQYIELVIKYCYYILGLSIASITYVINSNSDLKVEPYSINIALLLSVFFWLLSVFCGLLYIRLHISSKFYRSHYFAKKSKLSNQLTREQRKKEIAKFKHLLKDSRIDRKMVSAYKWQTNFFFFGVIFFVWWFIFKSFA